MMRLISNLNQGVGDGVAALYLVVFVVMVYDVTARYLFGSATVWGLELVIALAAIQYVLAGAHAIKNDMHVRIDVLYNLLPRRVRAVMCVVSYALSGVFLVVVAVYGWQQAAEAVQIGERSGAGWNSLAPTWMKIAIPAGATLMALQCVVQLVRLVTGDSHEQ